MEIKRITSGEWLTVDGEVACVVAEEVNGNVVGFVKSMPENIPCIWNKEGVCINQQGSKSKLVRRIGDLSDNQ